MNECTNKYYPMIDWLNDTLSFLHSTFHIDTCRGKRDGTKQPKGRRQDDWNMLPRMAAMAMFKRQAQGWNKTGIYAIDT